MVVINVIRPLELSAVITVVLWVALLVLVGFRLRRLPTNEEIFKLVPLSFSAAIAGSLLLTVCAAWFFPQLVDVNMQTVYLMAFFGAVISLLFSVANFWRAIEKAKGTMAETGTPRITASYQAVLEPVRPSMEVGAVLSGQELLNSLGYFKTIWERYGRGNMTRDWRPDHTKDVYMLSSALIDLDAKRAGSWDLALANKVRLTYKEMQSMASAHQHGKYEEAKAHGEAAYELATSLISFLQSERKKQPARGLLI